MNITIDLKDDCSENISYNFPGYFASIQKNKLSQYANYTGLTHWHDDVEFIAILSGCMKYNINGNIVDLQKGNGIFVNSRQLHHGFSKNQTECEFICVLLHPLLLCSTQQIEQKFIAPILSNNSFSYWLLHSAIEWENNILKAITEIHFHLDTQTALLEIQSLFYQIWKELYANAPKEQKQSTNLSHQLTAVKDMVLYIQKNYKEKIILSDIALAGNVCKSKCCSLFRNYLNQTPIHYLINYRLEKSIELMAVPDMNITEISYEVGFSGASYFTETFRKHFKCNPTEYRSKYVTLENNAHSQFKEDT